MKPSTLVHALMTWLIIRKVFDKGTVDSMICAADGDQAVYEMFKEVSRVLKKSGVSKYYVITITFTLYIIHSFANLERYGVISHF